MQYDALYVALVVLLYHRSLLASFYSKLFLKLKVQLELVLLV